MHDLPLTRDLLFVGGGHAHALVLRAWGMRPMPGVRVTVVNPGPTAPYTGMLPGHVAGHYTREELDIDLVRLCRFAGARLIDGAVTGLDVGRRVAHVPGRPPIPWDVASVDVGVTSEMPSVPGFADHAVPAKPLARFAGAWRAFLARARAGEVAPTAAVIGGGVAGVELAMAMAHGLHGLDGARVTVVEAEGKLTGTGERARAILRRAMRDLSVEARTGAAVERVMPGGIEIAGAPPVDAAFVTGAAGARPHDWIAKSGLPVEDGFLRVGPRLLVEGQDALFAAGDCAHMTHAPRPKAGVFAVRAAPVLHANIRAALTDGTMGRYDPQARYLKLISLGGKSALAERGGWAVAGPTLWRWKDRIDRRFMARLTDLPAMKGPTPPKEAPRDALAAPMLCAGCGAKVGGRALAQALAGLPAPARADVLSRPGDDAAVLAHGDGRQVVTTDHLRGFTEDGWTMTRIAAIHALGDVWAMGAEPQAALASITLPRMSDRLQARAMSEVMAAASEIFRAAGAELVGGHSTMGAEASFGFTVTGLVDRPIGHDGAREGDALVLTRPIGSGTILAAEMEGRARGADVAGLLRAMARPQGDAAAILSGAHAMTDVTGFGLAGHLGAICAASGTGAEVTLADVPLYPGAEALARDGVRSSLYDANRAAVPVEDDEGAEGTRAVLMHDPQTAGGLLAAVAEDRADELVARLRDAGHDAARIGRVVGGAPSIRLV